MGLDMYLYRKTYVKNWEHTPKDEAWSITIKVGNTKTIEIKPERITYIVEEIAYWRKANAIHKWFVDNEQDDVDECQESYIDPEQLKELLNVVKTVLASNKIEKTAKELLPTTPGFFFGSTEYDDYYVEDLTYTKQILESVLKEDNTNSYFVYRAFW